MSNMRVDVVTGPVRYRLLPLVVLVLFALVPVVALTTLLMWSDGQADEHEAAATNAFDEPTIARPSRPAAPTLATALLAYRRAPEALGKLGDDAQLADAMEQLASFVDERSCLAVSVDGRPVTAHNPATPVIPASTHKLLVAAVAVEVLGADHRFTTNVLAPDAVDGVIDGDVVLVGGGDPLLVSADVSSVDRYPEFNTTSLDALADLVAAAGVTSINGSVLGDGSRYDDEWMNPAWGAGVAGVEAGPYDALVVNDSRTLGRSARQPDPNAAAAREFARLLADRGVRIAGGSDSGLGDPTLPVIASVESEPLTAVIAEMLTTSDNDTAEMLLKELGVADSDTGTVAAGLNVVDRTLRTWGVPMDGVRLVDASGLSPENRSTCGALLAVLQQIEGTPVQEALALAGRTGTLQEQFVGTSMEGRLAGKTGTLGNPPADLDPPAVKALAGFVDTENASTIEFVLILNGPTIDDAEFFTPYWLALADRLGTYPAGPDRATVGPQVDAGE